MIKFDKESWKNYSDLMRLDKPIGTLLLLWPTLWALWVASSGIPQISILIIFVLGVFLMRTAGCIINDFADREFDSHVSRTKNRPLAQNKISSKEALFLFVVIILAAFLLALNLNDYTFYLSFAAFALAATYPFMKRFTYFPQVILGAAFAWSIPMAFAAITNEVPLLAWLIYTATLLWVLAYDTLYGMIDREDDIKLGLKSTAILFGDLDLYMVAFIQGLFLAGMAMLGLQLDLSFYYYIGWLIAALLVAQQVWSCRKRDTQQYFSAFLNNNYVGLALFVGLFCHYQFA